MWTVQSDSVSKHALRAIQTGASASHTQFDEVSNSAHDDEAHAYRLRNPDKLAFVRCKTKEASAHGSERVIGRVAQAGEGHTLRAAVEEESAVLEEVARDVRDFLELFRHGLFAKDVGSWKEDATAGVEQCCWTLDNFTLKCF